MRVHSSTIKSSFWLDLVNATIELKATPIGKGCIATGQTTEPAIQTTIKEEPAKNRYVLKTLAAALPASQPYLLWFGLRKDFWGTTPLPLELSGYGGPGCSIYVDLTLPLAGTTDAKGTVVQYYTTNPITFPNNPAYQGTPFFLQWWCVDPQRSSGLKVVFSQGQELSVPGNSAVARIYTSKNAAATTGTVEPGSDAGLTDRHLRRIAGQGVSQARLCTRTATPGRRMQVDLPPSLWPPCKENS
jgi:hypothetical protein